MCPLTLLVHVFSANLSYNLLSTVLRYLGTDVLFSISQRISVESPFTNVVQNFLNFALSIGRIWPFRIPSHDVSDFAVSLSIRHTVAIDNKGVVLVISVSYLVVDVRAVNDVIGIRDIVVWTDAAAPPSMFPAATEFVKTNI